MKNYDGSLIIFKITSVSVLLLGVFIAGFSSGKYRVFPYNLVNDVFNSVVVFTQEFPVMLGSHPAHFLQRARFPGDGVTVNELEGLDDYVAISSFYAGSNEIRLIRRDGQIIARWPVALSKLVPNLKHPVDHPATDWNVDIHGMVINRDGSIVFNFEYTTLVKLDRCGELLWHVPYQTHHSVERAESGGYWAPGRRYVSAGSPTQFPPIQTPYAEDVILKISEDGAIEDEISVPGLFFNSGLAPLLMATGKVDTINLSGKSPDELMHLNDIEELPSNLSDDFPQFHAGDLMLSMRYRNIILVVDPKAERIRWWRIGPWLRQHDPDFQPGGRITVFDNRVDHTAMGTTLGGSQILEYNVNTDTTRRIWGGTQDQRMYTESRGKHEMQPGGGVMIIEAEAGRLIETDGNGKIVWQYINRYDDDEVAEIIGARVLPAGYFDGVDWSCNLANLEGNASNESD